eukprot:GHRR01032523.1.p1 GENE.GHRR01032523.1~~GHRR01032523.1.p1  ORF type:complete len:118 (-),score=17.69 GHRR01032523.1:213-566(-)
MLICKCWMYCATQGTQLVGVQLLMSCCPAGALEDGVKLSSGQVLRSLASFESNVLYALRFMVDTNMGGGQWLELPPGTLANSSPQERFVSNQYVLYVSICFLPFITQMQWVALSAVN